MSNLTKIADLQNDAEKALHAAKELRKEVQASNVLDDGDKKRLGDTECGEKLDRAEKFYDEMDEHLAEIKRLSREQDAEDTINELTLQSKGGDGSGMEKTNLPWKDVAAKALERMETFVKDSDEDVTVQMAYEELEEDEQKSFVRVVRQAINRQLHYKSDKGDPLGGLSDLQKKVISTLSDSDGGYAVFEEESSRVIQRLRDPLFWEGRATKLTTNRDMVSFPDFDIATSMTKRGQNETGTKKNLADILGKQSFTLNKFWDVYVVPHELVEDQSFDLLSLIIAGIQLNWGEQKEGLWLTGTGQNEPYGILSVPTLPGQQVANAGAGITEEDIIDAIYGIRAVHRSSGVWMIPRAGIKAVRKLKDGNGRFHWQDGMQAGEPAMLGGYPVGESEYFPDNWDSGSANDPLMLFGDPSHYWILRKNNGVMIEILRELFSLSDQVGYKFRERLDGAPVKIEPFYLLKRKA